MPHTRIFSDAEDAERVQNPRGLILLCPAQKLRGLHAAARIAQVSLYPQAFRKHSVFDILSVTVGTGGPAAAAKRRKQHDAAHKDHPDGLYLVVEQEGEGQHRAEHGKQCKHAAVPARRLTAQGSRRSADGLCPLQDGITAVSGEGGGANIRDIPFGV